MRNGALEQLENINVERGKLFPDYKYYNDGNSLYYANAATGELGEMCNMLKKFLRDGEKATDKDGSKITPYEICLEVADVIIYLEFFCSIYGFSISEMLRYKFNTVSKIKNCNLFIEKK